MLNWLRQFWADLKARAGTSRAAEQFWDGQDLTPGVRVSDSEHEEWLRCIRGAVPRPLGAPRAEEVIRKIRDEE